MRGTITESEVSERGQSEPQQPRQRVTADTDSTSVVPTRLATVATTRIAVLEKLPARSIAPPSRRERARSLARWSSGRSPPRRSSPAPSGSS
jgi:hypothetical protein